MGRRDVIDALDAAADRGSPVVANRLFAALRKLLGRTPENPRRVLTDPRFPWLAPQIDRFCLGRSAAAS